MKIFISLLLLALFVIPLCGCSGEVPEVTTEPAIMTDEITAEATEPVTEPVTAPVTEAPETEAALPEMPKLLRITCVGDSITYGAFMDGQGSVIGTTYPALLLNKTFPISGAIQIT